jgi:hypothetical protein
MNTININRIIPSRIYAIGKAAADKEKSSPILMGVYVEFFHQTGIVHCRIAATDGMFLVQEIIRCDDTNPSDLHPDGLVFVLRNWQDLKAIGKYDSTLRGVSLSFEEAQTGRVKACTFNRHTSAGIVASATIQLVEGAYPSFAGALIPKTLENKIERIGVNMHYLAALEELWAEKGRASVVLYPHGRGMLCRPMCSDGNDRVALIMPIALPD